MQEVNIHEAKTHLSRLLQRVVAGEEIVISKAGKPLARLVPYTPNVKRRVLGQDVGKGWVADDFNAPLADELLTAFEGEA